MGRPVIAPSRLGFLQTDTAKLDRNFVVTADAATSHDDTWEQPWGERRFIRNRYTQLRVHLTERSGLQRRIDVVFRLYDDGIGFRYEFPDQPNLKTAKIGDELTEFAIIDSGTAWWIPAFEWNREEYLYNRTRIDSVGVAQTR
jgi:alpha-glucosidase